jgi:hypothetical protein
VDRPTGGRADENRFLKSCLETLSTGTAYKDFDRIAINVVSTPSNLVRCLQLADLVTSCSIAYLAGEGTWSPPLFQECIRPILTRRERVNGIGLKLHPGMCFENLYYWILDGTDLGWYRPPVPNEELPYVTDPYKW